MVQGSRTNLAEALHRHGTSRSAATALVVGGVELSYGELRHAGDRFGDVDQCRGAIETDDASRHTEVAVERMTEEELLKGLEGLAPPEEQPEEDE